MINPLTAIGRGSTGLVARASGQPVSQEECAWAMADVSWHTTAIGPGWDLLTEGHLAGETWIPMTCPPGSDACLVGYCEISGASAELAADLIVGGLLGTPRVLAHTAGGGGGLPVAGHLTIYSEVTDPNCDDFVP